MNFADLNLEPVNAAVAPMTINAANHLNTKQLRNWSIIDNEKVLCLRKILGCDEFDKIGEFIYMLIELEKKFAYYPDITFGNEYILISLFNKLILGLHMNDFIFAAKIDKLEDSVFSS